MEIETELKKLQLGFEADYGGERVLDKEEVKCVLERINFRRRAGIYSETDQIELTNKIWERQAELRQKRSRIPNWSSVDYD